MILDAHTPCPVCPRVIRDLYAVGRRVLIREQDAASPEYEELYLALDALRPWIEAHYSDQRHAFSKDLESAREPQLVTADQGPWFPELVEEGARR